MDPQKFTASQIDAFLKKWRYTLVDDNRAAIAKTVDAFLSETPDATAEQIETHLDTIHAK